MAKLLEHNTLVRSRFERNTFGLKDVTSSGVDMSLASLLALHGIEPPDIEAAIRASRQKARLPEKHDQYYAKTVGKACATQAPDEAESRPGFEGSEVEL